MGKTSWEPPTRNKHEKLGTITKSNLYTKKRYDIEKSIFNEIFGEYVWNLLLSRVVVYNDLAMHYFLDVVHVEFNVFGLLLLYWLIEYIDCTLIIT